MSFLLIVVTIFDGFKVTKSPLFIMIETILNLLIDIDFILRLKLVGSQAFFTNPSSGNKRWWNIFDAVVVFTCTMAFILTLIFRNGPLKKFGEMSEEFWLVAWGIWQTLRMILIAKKQKMAQ